jgi:cathepsin B
VYLRDSGVVGWTCLPYVASDATCPATKCDTSKATKYYSSGCYKLASARDIQAEILLNGPVEAGFTVYDDFTSYTSGVYIRSSSTTLGGHAVRLIGWGTENGVDYWIAANQWSSDWGDKGYFKYAFLSLDCRATKHC